MLGVILKREKIGILAVVGLWLAASIALCGERVSEASAPGTLQENGLLQVKVHRLIVDPVRDQPVIMLADSLEDRALPIWIGFFEANAIGAEMQGRSHRRPLTHDLLESIIEEANLKIQRTVITQLKERTYYATILMESEGALVEIDARPSDAIVMALKFKAPIFVSKSLFREQAIPLKKDKEIEENYGLTLQDLTPSLAQAFSFGSTGGILVSDVRKGSLAEKDGIKRGDIFVELGGEAIEDVRSMRHVLKKSEAALRARIFRKAHFLSITLHPN
ncbi:MAG: DUF151 domain-containing protein [Desulfobacteraceae bacterium]